MRRIVVLCLALGLSAEVSAAWNFRKANEGRTQIYTMNVSGVSCTIKYSGRDTIELEVGTEYGISHSGIYTGRGELETGAVQTGDPRRAFETFGCDEAVADVNNFAVRCLYMRARKIGFPTRRQREIYNCPSA